MWRATSGETILGKEEVVATINESGVGESTVYKLPQRSSGGVFCCFRSPGSRYGGVEARAISAEWFKAARIECGSRGFRFESLVE